jgi:hypothetical protein
MNDNYLWDRCGEPDPEVQELEEILGTLRYQPRPLEIPADIRVARKRNFFPMAIAAALAFFVIAAGLWFQLSRTRSAPEAQANRSSGIEKPTVQTPPITTPDQIVESHDQGQVTPPRQQPKKMLIANNKHREARVAPRPPALTEQELAEKEQVLTALRLVSAKLNLAQRKVQGLPQRNIFRNQKIG